MIGLLYTAPEQRELLREPDASAYHYVQQQRPSGAASIVDEATVRHGEPMPLLSDSPLGDRELGNGSRNTGSEQRGPQGTRGKRLPLKYLAGLFDADASVYIHDPCRGHKSYVALAFSNKRREFVEHVAASLTPPSAGQTWGTISGSDTHGWGWRVVGQRALNVLQLLRKYLVCLHGIAEAAPTINGLPFVEATARLQAVRDTQPPMPKHPTTKWTAGFIDGNGCFSAYRPNDQGSASPWLVVSVALWKRVAVDLLRKQFGGSVREFEGKVEWRLYLEPSKLRAFLEKDRIRTSLYLTTDRAYFLLKCARMGHYRDGETICAALADMTTQPHRMSGPGAVVDRWIAQVRDLPDWRKRHSDVLETEH